MVTVSLLEGIWTLIAVLGLCYSIPSFKDVRDDLRELKRLKINGDKLLMGRANVRNEFIRAAMLSVWGLSGVGAAFLPPNPNQSTISQLLGYAFISIELLIVYGTYKDRSDRKTLLRVEK